MAKSQIIKELAEGKISIESGLMRLLIISDSLNNKNIQTWILNELNGYKDSKEIPEYRKHLTTLIKYTGFNSRVKVQNQPLPITYFSKEIRENIEEVATLNDSVSSIETAINGNAKVGRDLTMFANDVKENTGILCVNIFMEFSKVSFGEIITNIKTKLLLILLELEKEFGNLDNLDIVLEKKNGKDIKDINGRITNILFANNKEV